VKTNRIRPAVRICVLSTFLALAAFSFLVFGSASAHALSRGAQAAGSSTTTTTVTSRIINNSVGQAVFSPSTVTVKTGNSVKIVNKTAFSRILFVGGSVVRLASGASMTIVPNQSQTVGICGGGGLSIVVN